MLLYEKKKIKFLITFCYINYSNGGSVKHTENKLWNRFIYKISILKLYLFAFHVNCFLAICKFFPITLKKEVVIWLLLFPLLNLQVEISLIQFWKLVLNCRFIHMISKIFKCRIKSVVCRWWYWRTMKQSFLTYIRMC